MKLSKKLRSSIKNKSRKVSKKKYTFEIVSKGSFYTDFSKIITAPIVEKYMNQLNSNDIIFEKSLINEYHMIQKNLFFEYRALATPSPFPLLNVTKLIDDLYKKNNTFDICVISNTYPHIVPFLLFEVNPFIFKKIKKIKIMLHKNLYTTQDPIEYSNIMSIINNVKNQKKIEIEGDFEYKINNYLENYIEDKSKTTQKYQTVLLFISYYMELYFSSKIYNHVLTGLFNLEKNGTLIIYTALFHHNNEKYELFTLLTTLFSDYKLFKFDFSDFYYDYTYKYEFYNFKGISYENLVKISKLLIDEKKNIIYDILNITNENLKNGELLLFKYIQEENKYVNVFENFIKYFKYDTISFIKFIANLTMNRIFVINNHIHNLKITYDKKNIKSQINTFKEHICCFNDYYREIVQPIEQHSNLSLDNDFHISSKKYDFDIIGKFILNIDINKKIYNDCSLKTLNQSQYSTIDNNTNKELLMDIIIKNQDLTTNEYIKDPILFVEHLEILNQYLLIPETFNHFHFGKNKQFIDSVAFKKQNKSYSKSDQVTLITCDDIKKIEIDGYDMSTLDHTFKEDTFRSSFYLMDNDEREEINYKIKEFEYSEMKKLYTVASNLSIGGNCCIKHLALPLNSYLYYIDHKCVSGFFINYLYLYLHLFKSITLFKPSITSNKSIEFYVIGTNFIGIEPIIQNKLLKILDNFEIHQTFFKKEDINEIFIKDIESFLNFMTNRYIDFENIRTILKLDLLEGIQSTPISDKFLNKSLLNKELNTTIFEIWKNKNNVKPFLGLKKLYYFTKFDIPDPTKITFDFSVLENILDKNDFIKMVNKYDAKDVQNSLYFIHTYLHKKNFIIPENTTLINILNVNSLANKDELYKNCYNFNKSLTNKYFMETHIYDKENDINHYKSLFTNNSPWYIKITNEYAGRGNFIVSSFDQFSELVNKIEKRKSNQHGMNLIINKYQENPLLFDKKKFHLRILYIVYLNSKDNIKSFMSKYGFIWTAKENYNNDIKLYDDVKIHDTHSSSTKTDYLFPNDFEKEFGKNKTNLVMEKILNILQLIAKVQVNNISNYPNSKNGYIILGTDFIINNDFDVKILEINNRTGLYTKHKNTNDFISKYLYENIYNEILTDVFNLKKIKVNEPFIPILS
jgi:hypothetical protein